MIDLHCHILPGIDDGPADMAESLDMARQAVLDGIHTIVATPHSHNGVYVNCQWRHPQPCPGIQQGAGGCRHTTGGALRRGRAYPPGTGPGRGARRYQHPERQRPVCPGGIPVHDRAAGRQRSVLPDVSAGPDPGAGPSGAQFGHPERTLKFCIRLSNPGA